MLKISKEISQEKIKIRENLLSVGLIVLFFLTFIENSIDIIREVLLLSTRATNPYLFISGPFGALYAYVIVMNYKKKQNKRSTS